LFGTLFARPDDSGRTGKELLQVIQILYVSCTRTTRRCSQLKFCTLTNKCLRSTLYRETAPLPFSNIGYRDYFPSTYKNCIATEPACNKNSAMMAKTTPWLLASRDHNCLKNYTLPGWTAQPTLTTFHHRAVRWHSTHRNFRLNSQANG